MLLGNLILGMVEADWKLTTGTLYRACDNATSMQKAREVLLSLAPENFKISLSSCYNYTENFRKGSAQAKRHHAGKDVNASVSLQKPPRTGVEQLVVNLHWSTANVNLIVDSSEKLSNSLVISKDAKTIIPADIAPVQRPGHSWSKRMELPDHTWDQSRTNAVTPMTFLFMDTNVTKCSTIESLHLPVTETTTLNLTRTGQAVTLLNLSFYERETTFKCLNEVLHLMTLPGLDVFFGNPRTGKLKSVWVFVVDNGPAEQPSCPMVQMCLIRLLNFLGINKITQASFAEYHSKRNFVERVHAEENRVLSKHGPFSSKMLYPQATPGSVEHKENMELMAEEIRACIVYATFGSKPFHVFRGVKPQDWVFADEDELENFLSLSEAGKRTFSPAKYTARRGDTLNALHCQWGLCDSFEGEYFRDYRSLKNELEDELRTAWLDKYTTAVYNPDETNECARYELQPIPDYLRWHKTGELHYLPLEEREAIAGPWDDIPEAYLPSKVLDLCFAVIQSPSIETIRQLSLLAWITPRQVKEYQSKIQNQTQNQIKAELEKERWKGHELYKKKTKIQLEATCRSLKIPVTASLLKHQLVCLISEHHKEVPPPAVHTLYSGQLSSIPMTLAGINNLTIPRLKSILIHHNIPPVGSKEQLVMKVHLLRHGQTAAITHREQSQINDLILLTYQVMFAQRKLHLKKHVYRKRTYSLQKSATLLVPPPLHVHSESDLQTLFSPLLRTLHQLREQRELTDQHAPVLTSTKKSGDNSRPSDTNIAERIAQTGSKIKVHWSTQEIGESGWRPGWYVAEVQNYCETTDMLTLAYASEPYETYEEELTPLVSNNKIKLVWSPL